MMHRSILESQQCDSGAELLQEDSSGQRCHVGESLALTLTKQANHLPCRGCRQEHCLSLLI